MDRKQAAALIRKYGLHIVNCIAGTCVLANSSAGKTWTLQFILLCLGIFFILKIRDGEGYQDACPGSVVMIIPSLICGFFMTVGENYFTSDTAGNLFRGIKNLIKTTVRVWGNSALA